jgi:hypothetical protein
MLNFLRRMSSLTIKRIPPFLTKTHTPQNTLNQSLTNTTIKPIPMLIIRLLISLSMILNSKEKFGMQLPSLIDLIREVFLGLTQISILMVLSRMTYPISVFLEEILTLSILGHSWMRTDSSLILLGSKNLGLNTLFNGKKRDSIAPSQEITIMQKDISMIFPLNPRKNTNTLLTDSAILNSLVLPSTDFLNWRKISIILFF